MKQFFAHGLSCDFQEYLDLYSKILEEKASKVSKTPKRPEGGKTLLELDKWFQEELSPAIQSRTEKHITHEELCKLMKWKLSRGKFRPRLTEMVQTNPPELVLESSKKAFKALPNLKKAIEALVVLKAVGPATASAILAAGAAESAPFMADESMQAIPGMLPLQYTLNHYLAYADNVKDCCKRLNAEAESKRKWTPHDVELALWTYQTAKQTGSPLFKDTLTTKRSHTEEVKNSSTKKIKK